MFFLKCYALAHSNHKLLSENLFFLKDVDAPYLWGRLLFFEEYHLFRALLAGNAARVQVNRWDRTHIPLWTIAVLCNSSYKSYWFSITAHVLPQSAGYKQDISISLCGGLLLESSDGTASRVTKHIRNLLKTPGSFLTFLTQIGIVDELRLCVQRSELKNGV